MDTSRLDLWFVNQLCAKSRRPRKLMAAASSEAELVAELLEYVLPVERFVVSLPRSLGTS